MVRKMAYRGRRSDMMYDCWREEVRRKQKEANKVWADPIEKEAKRRATVGEETEGDLTEGEETEGEETETEDDDTEGGETEDEKVEGEGTKGRGQQCRYFAIPEPRMRVEDRS
jgi:hypothetical protein